MGGRVESSPANGQNLQKASSIPECVWTSKQLCGKNRYLPDATSPAYTWTCQTGLQPTQKPPRLLPYRLCTYPRTWFNSPFPTALSIVNVDLFKAT